MVIKMRNQAALDALQIKFIELRAELNYESAKTVNLNNERKIMRQELEENKCRRDDLLDEIGQLELDLEAAKRSNEDNQVIIEIMIKMRSVQKSAFSLLEVLKKQLDQIEANLNECERRLERENLIIQRLEFMHELIKIHDF